MDDSKILAALKLAFQASGPQGWNDCMSYVTRDDDVARRLGTSVTCFFSSALPVKLFVESNTAPPDILVLHREVAAALANWPELTIRSISLNWYPPQAKVGDLLCFRVYLQEAPT